MNELVKKITQIAEKSTSKCGLLLVDVNVRGDFRNRIIEIFVDGEKNVTAADLAELSKLINSEVEEKKTIQGSYRLDVSTPGVDRPLKFLNQYPKNINRKFEVKYKSGEEKFELKAQLISVEGEDLIFLVDKTKVKVNFKDIISAKVKISFS